MNGKWIKSALMLAMLLISMVSLSTAAAIRTTPDTYVTQCGEELNIAAPGVLGNDVGTGLYVLDADLITLVKPNTGTLVVHDNGAFEYTAPVDAPGGLITGFYYTATDGTDSARSLAKIEFTSCKCQPPTEQCVCAADAVDIEICEGTQTPAQIEANITAGASCDGEDCDGTPAIDFPAWVTDDGTETGLVIAGSYDYTVNCTSECMDVPPATGTVNVVEKCQVIAPDFNDILCLLTATQAQQTINNLIASGEIACSGESCDGTPVVDLALDFNGLGQVIGGTVTVTCNSDLQGCGDVLRADLECQVVCNCIADAPDIQVPCKTTKAVLMAEVELLAKCNHKPNEELCDFTPDLNFDNVQEAGGFVTGGSYTVTCQEVLPGIPVEPDCIDTGIVTVETCPPPVCCIAKAVPLCGCLRVHTDFPMADFLARGGGCFNKTTGARCDETPDIDDSGVNYNKIGKYQYTVTCSGDEPDCQASIAKNYICIRYPICGPSGCLCPTSHCPTCL